jgi:hypothetical protein
MEQNQPNQPKEVHESQATKAQEEPENLETAFCDRPYEEVEDGFIDDRGFYTTPNGSFWDDEHTYFNHLGFDRHGGSYDKYGVYHPGAGYDEATGLYNDQKEFITGNEIKEAEKNVELSISKLKEQELKDEKTIRKYEKLEEESEDSDEEGDNSNVTYDEDEIKEAYDFVMENEKKNVNSTTVPKDKVSKKQPTTATDENVQQ